MTIIDPQAPGRQGAGSDITTASGLAAELAALEDRACEYMEASRAPATLRAYASDWKQFSAWCHDHGVQALPASPRTVASYLSDQATKLKTATLQRRLTTVSQAHQQSGHESPTTHRAVRDVWKGIKREHGTAHSKKQAVELSDVHGMVATLGNERMIDIRDRALLLVGFMSAFRRSEVVALDEEDVEVTTDGLVVTLRRSKTDQDGEGAKLGIPYGSDPKTCPVRAYLAWLEASGITEGALFRRVDRHGNLFTERISGRAYAARVKLLAGRVGFDPAAVGGHSTRRGFITSAVRANVPERIVMAHSRHKSLNVFRGYVEEASTFEENAAVMLLGGAK